ncbi:MAG: hypothetical protein LBU65_02490 [Planctomycetaceae bacterium]|nr:hypothetical protein [Planctomycetaceae bacterium]
MILTVFDETFLEGKAEGIVEGKTEGMIEGKADGIIRVLTYRIKEPPKSIQNKINSMTSIQKLDELLVLASTCVSMNEFSSALK